jgi:flagellar motility protein MotE (MotC chaperone)
MKQPGERKIRAKKWSSGRGALALVALLLIGSGLTRFASGSGAAIALEMKEKVEQALSATSQSNGVDTPLADVTPELLSLLRQAKEKQAALDLREADLEVRLQSLALAEQAIQDDIARLERAEETLRATMSEADQAAENDINRLTAVYENMKPDQAAALFQLMEPSFAAGFLSRMRADAAASILAGLTPDLAYSISVVLAGRNADVPREPVPLPAGQTATE